MKPNLWMYSTDEEMRKTAASLIIFGAGVFKRAKIINNLDLLKQIANELDSGNSPPNNPELMEFIFENLIDSVRIIVFFENYMKAELLINGFCINLLNRDIEEFSELAKGQFKRPVFMKEIHDISPFEVDENAKTIFHKALKETTLGFKELVGRNYINHYRFDQPILDFIIELNKKRNQLHLHIDISFEFSQDFARKMEMLNEFVNKAIQMLQPTKLSRQY
jgi:hypothetical protein